MAPPLAKAAAALIGLAALTGCTLQGSAVVGEDGVRVDVVVQQRDALEPDAVANVCAPDYDIGLEQIRQPSPPDRMACRLRGELTWEQIRPLYGDLVSRSGRTVYLSAPGGWFGGPLHPDALTDVDLYLTFPGRVLLSSSGTSQGPTLHLTDPGPLNTTGLWVAARDGRPLDPDVVRGFALLLAGAAAGALATALVLRRLASRPAPPAPAASTAHDEPEPAAERQAGTAAERVAAPPLVPEEPSAWSPRDDDPSPPPTLPPAR